MDSCSVAFSSRCVLIVITFSTLVFPGGTGCDSPHLVKGPANASIIQGTNHTFFCKGNGTWIDWKINGVLVYKLEDHPKLKLAPFPDFAYDDSCEPESSLTVHAKIVPEDNSWSTFAIQCVVKTHDVHTPVFSEEAYLTVHVIGGAGDVELISPASPEGPAIIQWIAPDVLSGSSSALYYNITVRDPSNQVIAQNTTTDTSFAIDSDLLVPCHSYELTLLPFQHISDHTELGIMTQTAKDYSGTLLPASDVKFSVSLEHDAPSVTITFKVNSTSCSFQWPESYTVTVLQGTNTSQTFQSVEQMVMDMENEYTIENLDLRQKYQLLIKLERSSSSSIPVIANISTFYVQNLTLTEQEGGCELDVHCDMAKGAEDKNCTVMMRNETGVLQQSCFPTGGRNTTCKLSGLALGKYKIQGYDWEGEETPAVERVFFFTKNSSECLTNTAPTIRTDDTTTLDGSPSRFEDKEPMQNVIVVGIVAPLIVLVLAAVGLVSTTIVAVVVVRFRRRKQKDYNLRVHDTEAAHTKEYVYLKAQENKYDEHNVSQQRVTPTEPTDVVREPAYADAQSSTGANGYGEHNLSQQQSAVDESTDAQKTACDDAQTVTSTTAATNNSPNQ